MGFEETWSEIQAWPREAQLLLAHSLLDRLAEQEREPKLNEELRAELDRRIAELDAHPERGIPWEEVEAEFERRFGSAP